MPCKDVQRALDEVRILGQALRRQLVPDGDEERRARDPRLIEYRD
jgi:hypothetical protein